MLFTHKNDHPDHACFVSGYDVVMSSKAAADKRFDEITVEAIIAV
jgi:hypothetical protein